MVDVHRLAPAGYGTALDAFKARVVGSRAEEPGVPVRYPGQRAAALRREREHNGVPLDRDVRESLLDAVAERIRTRMGDRASRRYLSVLRIGQRNE